MCVDDPELVIHAGTIWKLTIQVERRIVDTSCPLRGEEDGMTDLVRLYLCEMRGKPGEAVVGARTTFSRLPYFCKLQTLFTFR